MPSDDPVITRPVKPHRHTTPVAAVCDRRTSRAGEAAIITAAKEVLVKEILELLGDDLKDPLAHARWLMTLPLETLKSRRDQIKTENQREFKMEGNGQ